MKQKIFSVIKNTHKVFASRELPNHLGLYFHALEPQHYKAFSRAINHFTAQGYKTMSSSSYLAAPQTQKCLFISFDDNYKGWHSALPVLKQCDVTATFYVNSLPFRNEASDDVISDYFDRIDYHGERIPLSVEELKEISDNGHEIGCHSHSHFVLSSLSSDLWDTEIRCSKEILEKITGQDITSFSYPYGMRRHFSGELKTYCLQNGFTNVAAAIPGMLYKKPDSYTIHRTRWHLHNTIEENLTDLSIDGQLFERLTGKSAVG